MIIGENPSPLKLFFVVQGSIVPQVLPKMVAVALLSVAVLLVDRFVARLTHVPISAMGAFGVALSLFPGFRNNAAYDRWWEGRKLWEHDDRGPAVPGAARHRLPRPIAMPRCRMRWPLRICIAGRCGRRRRAARSWAGSGRRRPTP